VLLEQYRLLIFGIICVAAGRGCTGHHLIPVVTSPYRVECPTTKGVKGQTKYSDHDADESR
jgi:hypothetical protein